MLLCWFAHRWRTSILNVVCIRCGLNRVQDMRVKK